ncbi:MAG: hypothetical protein F2565_00345 [Actinobacteria bacterium]|nr:hypothetical protein [Actinomycetota bacterium]
MRENIVNKFIDAIDPFLDKIETVAVIGASNSDPEIIELKKKKNFELTTYGIDAEADHQLDLNIQTESKIKYDLILCSQVLEHLYDVKSGLVNLVNLMDKDSLLWIGCPASNMSHGSPYYFSAGYQPELITKLAEGLSLQSIVYGRVGTKRNYFMIHALRIWPTTEELIHPIIKYNFSRLPKNSKLNALRYLRDLPGRIYASLIENKISNKVEYASETFVWLKK